MGFGTAVGSRLSEPDGENVMKKVLAITQRVEIIEGIGERRDAISQEWIDFVETCGFLPLLLPNHLSTVKQILEKFPVEGFLLTGGNDLVSYGGAAPERDEMERYLIQISMEKKVSILGVCRGMQMILDFFGTSLQRVEGHVRREHRLDNGDIVNSFHNWGVKECNSALTVLSYSDDGIVEEVKHSKFEWIRGIMWHPERHHPFRERDVKLIQEVFGL